jgi:hypothetical protein
VISGNKPCLPLKKKRYDEKNYKTVSYIFFLKFEELMRVTPRSSEREATYGKYSPDPRNNPRLYEENIAEIFP